MSTVVESLLIILCLYCIYKCIRRPHNILKNIYFKDHIVMKELHVLFICLLAVLGSNKDCLNLNLNLNGRSTVKQLLETLENWILY